MKPAGGPDSRARAADGGLIPPPLTDRPVDWWPLPDAAGHADAFAALDDDVPVLFAPVRIETRFTDPTAGQARRLKVRIYPDQFHIDDHDPALTDREMRIGRTYWRAWDAAVATADPAAQTRAREWLVARLPARRAAWVARQTKPDHKRPDVTDTVRPPRATCLPDHWAVIGFTREKDGSLAQTFTAWTRSVRSDLPAGVDLNRYGTAGAEGALPTDDGMRWMIDYDEAVDAGMAVTVDLTDYPTVARTGLAVLLVVGVSSDDPGPAAEALMALLEAHNYAEGVAFVPQGTPTNNTDQVDSAWSFREVDPLALLGRELDGADAATATNSNGKRAARALGRPDHGLFGRLENADDDEETSQEAMNRALWPVTWGEYFSHLLAGVDTPSAMPPGALADFKRRYFDDVRGGAPLPSLRVGAQPYGLLPVRYSQPAQHWSDKSPWFEYTLHFFRQHWLETADAVVPRMDPVLGATGGSASKKPDSVLTEILSNLPHPSQFLIRELRSWRTTDTESIDEFGDVIVAVLLPFLYFDDPTFGHEALSVLGRWGWALAWLGDSEYLGIPAGELTALDRVGLANADAQIAALQNLRGRVNSLLESTEDRDSARAWIDSMVNLVEQHKARQSPLLEVARGNLDFSGIVADEVDDPTIFYSVYAGDEDTATFDLPLVRSSSASAASYLRALRDRVPPLVSGEMDPTGFPDPLGSIGAVGRRSAARAARGRRAGRSERASRRVAGSSPPILDGTVDDAIDHLPGHGLPPAFHSAEPLLYQLLDGVVEDVAPLDRTSYTQAVDNLAAEPEDRLELRLRETLGLASNRLDAYFTSMARRRLDQVRGSGGGVQLGGYGWVVDLVPDKARALDSQGFIHAPSTQQATTAAILRSGWSAHGTADDTSSMAVNLAGDRVRLAAWLLDGIRQGQSLGELLGYRFERGLHDASLSAWIDPVRRAVLRSHGIERDPRGPVDGLDLLDLYATRKTATSLLASVPAEYVPPGSADTLLGPHFDGTAAALDAAGDAAIAESVHQVAQGNMTRAAATLDALNLGEVAPPELHSVRTPSGGDGITHRVVVLLGERERTGGWATGTARGEADPALDAWASRILGPATGITARVRRVGTNGVATAWEPVTMAQLELAALDAVFDAPPPNPTVDCRWGRRIEAMIRRRMVAGEPQEFSVEVDFATGVPGQLAMTEVAEVARDLRSLIGRGRSLTGNDLAPPDDASVSEVALTDAETRVEALEATFRSRARALLALLPSDRVTDTRPRPVGDASPQRVRDTIRSLTDYPLLGALPVVGYRGDEQDIARLWDAAWSLGDKVGRVLARLNRPSRRPGPPGPTTEVERLRRLAAIWETILGRAFPLIVPVVPPATGPLARGGFDRSADLVGADPAAVFNFITQAGRVRPDVRLIDHIAMLSELLHNAATVEWKVAQLPAVDNDPWVATGRPTPDTGGRVHWVAADHRGSRTGTDAPVAGLFVDEWVERVPRTTQTTGVAVHFDAPASRPPQSLLLAVTPDADTPWTFDLAVATLMQTLEDARLRAVSPQMLSAYGHHLPVIFSPGTLTGTAT